MMKHPITIKIAINKKICFFVPNFKKARVFIIASRTECILHSSSHHRLKFVWHSYRRIYTIWKKTRRFNKIFHANEIRSNVNKKNDLNKKSLTTSTWSSCRKQYNDHDSLFRNGLKRRIDHTISLFFFVSTMVWCSHWFWSHWSEIERSSASLNMCLPCPCLRKI